VLLVAKRVSGWFDIACIGHYLSAFEDKPENTSERKRPRTVEQVLTSQTSFLCASGKRGIEKKHR
jgi:hypothetical protein